MICTCHKYLDVLRRVFAPFLIASGCLLCCSDVDFTALKFILSFFFFPPQSVYHDIDSKFKRTTLRMKKQNEGDLHKSSK